MCMHVWFYNSNRNTTKKLIGIFFLILYWKSMKVLNLAMRFGQCVREGLMMLVLNKLRFSFWRNCIFLTCIACCHRLEGWCYFCFYMHCCSVRIALFV